MILLVMIAGALLITAASRTENHILRMAGQIWILLNCIAGSVGLLLIRGWMDTTLVVRSQSFSMIDENFYRWALERFDRFAFGLLVAVALMLGLLLWVVWQKNEQDFVFRNFFSIGYSCMILLLIASVWYGIGTINKLFDLAAWIGAFTLSACGVLHLPLFLRLRQLHQADKIV